MTKLLPTLKINIINSGVISTIIEHCHLACHPVLHLCAKPKGSTALSPKVSHIINKCSELVDDTFTI